MPAAARLRGGRCRVLVCSRRGSSSRDGEPWHFFGKSGLMQASHSWSTGVPRFVRYRRLNPDGPCSLPLERSGAEPIALIDLDSARDRDLARRGPSCSAGSASSRRARSITTLRDVGRWRELDVGARVSGQAPPKALTSLTSMLCSRVYRQFRLVMVLLKVAPNLEQGGDPISPAEPSCFVDPALTSPAAKTPAVDV